MGSPRKSARAAAGYTLVELMMIVMIIAVSVMAFAPSFGRAMGERRVSTATRELIRIGRRARSDSFGYLRAHLLWIQPTGAGVAGRVQLLRGSTNSCSLEQWSAIQLDCAAQAQRCLEDLLLDDWSEGYRSIALFEETVSGSAVSYQRTKRAICFAPNGVVFHGTAAKLEDVTLSDANNSTIQGGFVYTLHAGSEAPSANDRVHRVLFPLGTTPRALR